MPAAASAIGATVERSNRLKAPNPTERAPPAAIVAATISPLRSPVSRISAIPGTQSHAVMRSCGRVCIAMRTPGHDTMEGEGEVTRSGSLGRVALDERLELEAGNGGHLRRQEHAEDSSRRAAMWSPGRLTESTAIRRSD